MSDRRPVYQWVVLQEGTLPLQLDGSVRRELDHACTSVLLWPEGERPGADDSLLTDPCFTREGWQRAQQVLFDWGCTVRDLGWYFETHTHWDHQLRTPGQALPSWLRRFDPAARSPLAGVAAEPCPGHERDLHAIALPTSRGPVWVVGDAILSEVWLREWKVYWPNQYADDEVVEHWRTVAKIVTAADQIVPGHGPPFAVTDDLVADLLANFDRAPFADRCPDVRAALAERLAGV
jgi:glyoxylase-like metal-dependent hydrolase (beta-lactamase superfamily II)